MILISWEKKINRVITRKRLVCCIYKRLQYFEMLCWAKPSDMRLAFDGEGTTSAGTELTVLVGPLMSVRRSKEAGVVELP